MKKALVKDTIKEIKNTYKRFLSILLMAFLGVGFFAGIRAASPDMVNTIDEYYKQNNVYDIEIVSTLGLTNSDIEALQNVENVDKVNGSYSKDGIIKIEDAEIVTKVLCIEDVNKPVLLQGELPKNENECVVESEFLKYNEKNIGDTIELNVENMANDDGDEVPYLKQKEVKIVGVVKSPIYISRERGTSKLGAGKINYFVYVSKDNINVTNTYTEIYIKVKNSDKYVTSTNKYEDYIKEVKTDIEEIKEERQNARKQELVDKANNKVNEAEEKLNKEKGSAQEEISKAENEILDAKKQIRNGESELNKNKQTADSKFLDAKKQIDIAKKDIRNGENELKIKEEEVNKKISETLNQKNELTINLESVKLGINTLNTKYNQVIEELKNPDLTPNERAILEQTKTQLETDKTGLESTKGQLEFAINQIDQGIQKANKEIQNAKNTIQNSKNEINKQEKTMQVAKTSTDNQIELAKEKLATSKQEIIDGETKLEDSKKEFNEKILEAEEKLVDAKDKIKEIEKPSWYILDRNQNAGYASFIQDTKSIENIGAVFPIVFFVIATLISLTSMTRMVEEERSQIGTLKALGYNKFQIASKYIVYASLACIIGGILGMSVGFILLPKIIWMMYEIMYNMKELNISFNIEYGTIGLFVASVCIIGATIYVAFKELIHTPAMLMRPKAPKIGKKVFLERIPFIWKHLSFTRKVTFRNIFRYKKRFLMTIIGIFGCTSLIIAGFGIRDSIRSILPEQYGNVFNFDMQINLKNNLNEEQINELVNNIKGKEEIKEVIKTNYKSSVVKKDGKEQEAQIAVTENKEDLQKVVNLRDAKIHKIVELNNNEIAITDKLAQLVGVKKGDIIKLENTDKKEKEFKVADIVENYVGHYVYMSKELYENSYKSKYDTNVLFVQESELGKSKEEQLSKEIIDKNEIASVSLTSSMMASMDETLSSMNYVVIILIVSAGILAFVVLYNLSNVNISERIRELATIKVLGFYDKEVYKYVARETVILTAIGIALGIFGGYILNSYIIQTCEINALRFVREISPLSYIYSILITIGFTMIVNIVTYFSLKKINMIESLKSVE